MSQYLIIITGPTAVGKTALTIQLAQQLNTEIISCDARQFYRELNIGVARPSEEELAAVPHHFIGHRSIHDDYNAGQYAQDALAFLEEFHQKNQVAIMTGGSGLYIQAVTEGLNYFPPIDPNIRKNLQALYEKEGLAYIQKLLAEQDPVYHQEVDLNNHTRILRALEVCQQSNKPYSSFKNKPKEKRPFKTIQIALQRDRAELYDRINQRVDMMIEMGLIEEAKALYPLKGLNALSTVGYQELFAHWDGKYSLDEAINKIKQHSRNYAKRQMTWFRRTPNIEWFHPDEIEEIIAFIQAQLKSQSN